MNKTISTVVIIIVVAGIAWGAYYFGTQKTTINTNKTANENVNQNINSGAGTVNEVEIDNNFTLQLNQTASLKDYSTDLKLTDLVYNQSSGRISSVLELSDADTDSEEITLTRSGSSLDYYHDKGKLRIILKEITTQTASFLIVTRFLSEDDYYCVGGANCMPITPPEKAKFCSQSYIKWAQENCPDFGVVY